MKTVGLHTPKFTEKCLNRINLETGLKFKDASWGNDCTDSIWSEENDITVYVPNSVEQDADNELFNQFTLVMEEDEFRVDYDTIEEVIQKIKEACPVEKDASELLEEAGLTVRELLEQRNDMLKTLKFVDKFIESQGLDLAVVKESIKKAEK